MAPIKLKRDTRTLGIVGRSLVYGDCPQCCGDPEPPDPNPDPQPGCCSQAANTFFGGFRCVTPVLHTTQQLAVGSSLSLDMTVDFQAGNRLVFTAAGPARFPGTSSVSCKECTITGTGQRVSTSTQGGSPIVAPATAVANTNRSSPQPSTPGQFLLVAPGTSTQYLRFNFAANGAITGMFPAYFFGPGSTGGQWFPTGTIQHLANCTSVLTINQTRSGIYYQAAPEVNGQVTINISLSVVIRYSNCAAPLTTGTPCTTCGQDTATGGLIV